MKTKYEYSRFISGWCVPRSSRSLANLGIRTRCIVSKGRHFSPPPEMDRCRHAGFSVKEMNEGVLSRDFHDPFRQRDAKLSIRPK
ncbi:uncharacterized protein EAF01_002528 [Botrytis porri]|uniref:uncharacterized protein n=1 Tax=Botrytis porri TaxID=87229 RepID=UPI001902A8E0|nr:uncharacterized protein EAF01_002528 [Botrytis porri]KAF7911020.1 hypothetical protein EAF01_002528 [Botrytis porri]